MLKSNQPYQNVETEHNYISALGMGSAGALALYHSQDAILGRKTMYHGTSKEAADSIRQNGLFSSYGGTGASLSINNADYIKASQNKVHLTRFKSLANWYANGAPKGTPKEFFRSAFTKGTGDVVKTKMDYDKFKKMDIDNAGVDDISNIPIWQRSMAKNMAAKGSVDIGTHEIVGGQGRMDRLKHSIHKMPSYMKNNPIRFGMGVAVAGLGAYAIGKGIDEM